MAVQEYIATLSAAGFKIEQLPFDHRYSPLTRVWNRLVPRVMLQEAPRGLVAAVDAALGATDAQFLFFCARLFPALSTHVRRRFPNVHQVFLSVGVESLDFCIDQQLRRVHHEEDRSCAQAARMLGQQILEEAQQRALIDAVLTLSPLDTEVEKWLGAPRALWMARSILESPLQNCPVEGRVGTVSTLDHPPNRDGLTRVLDELVGKVSDGFRFRLVGGPEMDGSALSARYHFVDYLGRLSNVQLRAEATTWCCFVHPLFVYAKGCSTKLASALGWGLPVATTEYGVRGYCWDDRILPIAKSPVGLTQLVIARSRRDQFSEFQLQTRRIAELSPSLSAVAVDVRDFLLASE